VRAQNPARLTAVERAARLIFLNKTCYNGLFRENSRGEFNVPFGRYRNPTICDPGRLRAASQALQGVTLSVADFAQAAAAAGPGDFVYFDPPYAPISATSSFTGYNRHGFDPDDQARLARVFHDLTDRGCNVMLSNSDTSSIRELYGGRGYHIQTIRARRSINSNPSGRGPVTELLITNYTEP
jgi:DNA adenine methylase